MEYKFAKVNFKGEIYKSEQPVLIDFNANWCGPYKMMNPVVSELAEQYDGKIKIGKVNTDEQPELASLFNVMSIPNFVFIKNGQVVDQVIGVTPKNKLEEKLNRLL